MEKTQASLISSSYNSRNLLESTYTTFKITQIGEFKITLMSQTMRQILPSRFRRRPTVSTLLAVGISLSFTISGCSPTEKTATEQIATEQAATDAAGASNASNASNAAAAAKIYAEDGVAIKGADPVAYYTDSTFVSGSADYTYEWGQVTWQFSTAENRDLFAANPEQYAPQYGGYCAWAVGQNALAAIDPTAWSIVDGKLYLNANKRIQDRWNKDIPGNIALAEANWPSLSQQ